MIINYYSLLTFVTCGKSKRKRIGRATSVNLPSYIEINKILWF